MLIMEAVRRRGIDVTVISKQHPRICHTADRESRDSSYVSTASEQ